MAGLAVGISGEASVTVSKANTAVALKSGTVEVFGTPGMIALVEEAAVRCLTGKVVFVSKTTGTHNWQYMS